MVVAIEIHDKHLRVVRIKALARSFILWPNLDRDLEDLGRRCERRQSQKGRPARALPSHPWIYPAMPWERVHADFVELSGRLYLLMIDVFSKWPDRSTRFGHLCHHRADHECDETNLQLSRLTQKVGDG